MAETSEVGVVSSTVTWILETVNGVPNTCACRGNDGINNGVPQAIDVENTNTMVKLRNLGTHTRTPWNNWASVPNGWTSTQILYTD